VNVDGPGSSMTSGMQLIVGRNGVGTLNITNGGFVDSSPTPIIGSGVTGSGLVVVRGAGSLWDSGSHIIVGQTTGALQIFEAGQVNSISTTVGLNNLYPTFPI